MNPEVTEEMMNTNSESSESDRKKQYFYRPEKQMENTIYSWNIRKIPITNCSRTTISRVSTEGIFLKSRWVSVKNEKFDDIIIATYRNGFVTTT